MLEFKLTRDEHIPLCDLLKIMKLCESGAVAKHLIADGKVKVDGVVELRKRAKIRKNQVVEFDGKRVQVV
ncbi:MAG: hypothetical protein A2X86_10330 [Bdellovibrionales bacterium GWA2_49_15]|nr:MAG: hypothetical protein A2X86_10330 [Bdellovibrionales bacterium GWA2_49_15]